jgi:hypothetical protein
MDGTEFTVRPYRSALSLDRMVQPYLSAGGGSTGGFLRGGVVLSFGDMLGDQQLQTALQAGKSVDDFAAQASYVNMRSRWNWGVLGGQVPWVLGGRQTPFAPATDGRTLSRDSDTFRQLHRQLSGLAIYPFSGARRVELSGGVQSISFDRETTTRVYSSVTGQVLNETTATGTTAASAHLFETGAALVSDTAVFGPTSPILGERYRFGVAPTFGTLRFTTVTADYRKYLMPVRPFTIAMRVLNVGRYGSDANDPRLLPLAWTLRDVVRGYGDTGPDASPVSYLSAIRMLVGNLELRFPVARAFRRADQRVLPIEALVFSDMSGFWTSTALSPGATRNTLRSVGAGMRVNAAGFVFELDAVRPFDQPSNGWAFAFNVRPGF